MALLIRTHYKLAKESIRRNRTRSFLTCLGIAIGVASIIMILSLTGSINNMISGQIKAMGADLIVVRPTRHMDAAESVVKELTSSNQYLTSNLTLFDARVVAGLEDVAASAPITTAVATLSSEDREVNSAMIVGTSADLMKIESLQLTSGTFLSNKVENAAVIGKKLSQELFGTLEPVGQTFKLLDHTFIIVGLLEEQEDPINFNNVDFDSALIVSADYLEKIGGKFQVQQINVKAVNTSVLPALSEEMTSLILAEKSGDKNFEVLYGDAISHPAGGLLSIISGMLTFVAGVSLLVGGVGVMNILLVSVAERTREIGIRKAVGASSMNILLQFMFEAIILSLSGGVLGMILGYLIAFLVSIVTPFAPYISLEIVLMAIGTSMVIGVVFGMYPAIKAAKKNPIESLRYYR